MLEEKFFLNILKNENISFWFTSVITGTLFLPPLYTPTVWGLCSLMSPWIYKHSDTATLECSQHCRMQTLTGNLYYCKVAKVEIILSPGVGVSGRAWFIVKFISHMSTGFILYIHGCTVSSRNSKNQLISLLLNDS